MPENIRMEEFYITVKFKERWKKIKDYPNLISNFGRIKSLKMNKIMKIFISNKGYKRIGIYKNKKRKNFYIHRLVTRYFIGKFPEGKEVNHIDGDKLNNKVWNLEYVTHSENRKHAFEIGLQSWKGEKHPQSKIKDNEIPEIKKLYKSGLSQYKIAKIFKINQCHVSRIINDKRRAS